MFVSLNIGLATQGGPDIAVARAVLYAEKLGVIVAMRLETVTHDHGTERTIVARVDTNKTPEKIRASLYLSSVVLAQDCIAVFLDDEGGYLCGPRPYAEGFQLKYFKWV